MEINRSLEVLRTNIIKWYQFQENSKILIIGNEMQSMYEFLNQHYDVKLQIDNQDEKFDYIIIKDQISLLESFKKNLTENGTILLLLNNRWGVTYFAGSDGFKTLYENQNRLLSKEEIEKTLNQIGFDSYKFFYPLPNYDFANVIYSDEYLPEVTDSKLANNNIYLEDNYLVFNEIELLKSFTRNGDFTKFTNSFLVEVNPKSEEKAIFFNNTRKDEYRLITKIYDGKVEKEAYSNASKNHLNSIKENVEDLVQHGFYLLDIVEGDKLTSKYVTFPNMYQEIIKKIKNNEIDSAISLIEKNYNDIKAKFSSDKTTQINQEYFKDLDVNKFFIVKKAYIDLVFENMFFENEKIFIYDQEWTIENCPLEFILFRTINNMYMMNSEIKEIISREEMLEKFGLLEDADTFFHAELTFQSKVLDEEMFEIYFRVRKLEISKEELITAKKNFYDIGLYKAENEKKEKYILELQGKIDELELKLQNK